MNRAVSQGFPLAPRSKIKDLVQIYQPSNRYKNDIGKSGGSKISKSNSRMSSQAFLALREGQGAAGTFKGSADYEEQYHNDEDRQLQFSGTSGPNDLSNQALLAGHAPTDARFRPQEHEIIGATPTGDPEIQAFFKSSSSMMGGDQDALLQRPDETIEDDFAADEEERLKMEQTNTNLLSGGYL